MTSQFAFLVPEFPDLHDLATRAEAAARSDARIACGYARLTLEALVGWLYDRDGSLRQPYERTLAARLHEPSFQRLVGVALSAKARVIRDLGNRALHEARATPAADGVLAVRELFHLTYWLARTYARGAKPSGTQTFSAEALPMTAAVPVARLDQLKEAARRYVEAVAEREAAEKLRRASDDDRARLEAELTAARAEVAAAKAANARLPDTHDYGEAETRDKFIDLLLREAGWPCNRPGIDTEFPVTGMPNASGDGFVDYVLWGADGRPLGLIEAKRTRKDPREGQQQAKLYADALEARFGQRPVIFYSNGYDHWIWDDGRDAPRPIQGFLTRDELELSILRRTTRKALGSVAIDAQIVDRYYQSRAIRRIAEAFEIDHQRRALLVMATGSGKTRTVIALCDVLMKANWARRVLFLADRTALVNQAVGAFRKRLPSASAVNLVTDKTATGRVYVSTYPTMMNLIDQGGEGARRFGPGHFDLIVIDEAHRSVYRKFGAIFDYFDSLLVGLTATPKAEIDRDTYRLFDLQRGVPTDAYDLDEAVKDRFLVPMQAVSVPLKFEREGIRYDDLPDEEEAWDAVEWDEDGTVPAIVEPAAVNRWLFNADTVDKVLEFLMREGQKVADGDRLGKTIVFAKNQDHARFVVQRFDRAYPHLAGHFARVITSGEPYAQSLLDDFSQPDKAPHIAVSVDMLDTGVDVPEVVNLVFFKIVRSKTKFWQMIGRGTRLREDLFGPGRHKTHFSVFDFCQNFEFFNANPDVAEPTGGESLGKRLFTTRVELIATLDAQTSDDAGDYGSAPAMVASVADQADAAEVRSLAELRQAVATRLREEVGGMSLDNFLVRPRRRLVETYARPESWTTLALDARHDLTSGLAGLPSSLTDDDQAAKEFDLLILRAQIAVLKRDPGLAAEKDKIVRICGLLEELSNVPMVARELPLIQEVQEGGYWIGVTAAMLETVRRRLRLLVKLIEAKRRPIVYTDFEDTIGEGRAVSLPGAGVGTDVDRFRLKALQFLNANRDHIAVVKVHRNEPLTPTDLAELERIFVEAGVAADDDIARLRGEGGLGRFVRSLVGLDRQAAKAAFSGFTAARTLTAHQIEFTNLIIDHLTARGEVAPRLLYESPFTDFDPLGVAGVFAGDAAEELISILEDVRRRAAA